jgi:hypothetical protein
MRDPDGHLIEVGQLVRRLENDRMSDEKRPRRSLARMKRAAEDGR